MESVSRQMMRTRYQFRSAVWRVVNPNYHRWGIEETQDNIRPRDACKDCFEPTLDFWVLDYVQCVGTSSALREILSDAGWELLPVHRTRPPHLWKI
jgi:hypothetical protein